MRTGSELIPKWIAPAIPLEQLPPLQHIQKWIQDCRELEKQDDIAAIAIRRELTKHMFREDWDLNTSQLFKKLANACPSPPGYLSETRTGT